MPLFGNSFAMKLPFAIPKLPGIEGGAFVEPEQLGRLVI
jgi:hypothetical protein